MKKNALVILLLFTVGATSVAQQMDTTGSIRPFSNTLGYDYPRIDKNNRAIFRVRAPQAKKVQINLAGMNEGIMGADSVWTVITRPLDPGFHYYSLVIDGVSVVDPSTASYFGTGKWSSGIEVPTPGEDFYMPKQVPHGEIRIVPILRQVMIKTRKKNILCCIYNTAWLKMKQAGPTRDA
jgi:enterochelin esterase family protein